jgi:type II secretory pathway component GspD/PulD (secretin)
LVARAGVAFLLAAAGLAYAGPKVAALVDPAGVKHDSSQSQMAAVTSPAAKTPNIVAEGLGAPNQLNGFPQLVPPPNVIPTADPVGSRLSSGVVGGLPPSLGRSSVQPSSGIVARDSGSDRNLEPAPPERVPSFVQVLPLKGDPAAVEAVTKAFCDLNACRVVIRAQTSQVVVVGTNAEVAMLTRLLDDLGERPPGLLVQAIILELDDSANQALGLSVGGESGRTALDVSQTIGSGSGIALSYNLGGFVATLEALQANGAARVLTAPSVMSWAGEKSSVRASQEVPVLSQIVSENSGSTRQGIEYRDSGILLDLEQITAGPKPIFRANLEVSAFVATETGVKGSPTKSSRTLSTVAELPLGQVLLLGGIERGTSSVTQDRLPILNVPISKRSRTSNTRIYVALIATAPTPLASSRALAAEAAR